MPSSPRAIRAIALLAVAAAIALAPCAAAAATATATATAGRLDATLTITDDPAGPRIEPAIYGQFVEHLGTGVYGGLWVGPESPIPNTSGFRNDVLAALKALKVPVVRWPGGCFADDYDWRDGVGPPAKRPVRLNKVWGNVPDDNRVGTHEFMDFVEMIGADAYIAGNMGSMPPRAMSQWLEYMTSSDPRSSLADERRRNGRDAPWRVRYFGVGNETWGCGGHMRPEYAADLHRQYAQFLRAPVEKVASGDGQGDDHVTEVMMARAGDDMDAISLHYYTVVGPWEHKGPATGFDAYTWARTLKRARAVDDRIAATAAIMDRHDPKKRVALFVDEWGLWHDPEPGTNGAFLQQQNTLRDAMVAALTFDVFHRHTDRVRMANVAQMVNVLQAVILTDGPRMLLTPTYHAFDLYRPFQGATPLKTTLSTPRYAQGDVDLPAVDVSAARGADGATTIALVNLDPAHAARVVTNLDRAATGRLLTAPEMDAHNTFEHPAAIAPVPYAAGLVDGRLTFDLPAKSIVVVSVPARAVKVNQLGFLPGAAKWAVVPDSGADRFTLVDARTGATVFRGALGAAALWAPAAQTVRLADFSAWRTPGTYRLHAEGAADSPAFTIAADAYDALDAAALRAFYHQRASTALPREYAGPYARAAGHPDDHVLVHASAASPSRPAGTSISCPKGWYDAGDYNKYVVNSGISTYTLLAAWEHFPAYFRARHVNLPESGGALPDLLAETLWNLEWMLCMQDPADGGVYHKLTNADFDRLVMPDAATSPRYVVAKSTAAALDFAAVMATASRVFAAFDAQRPGLSARMRAAAERAYAWARAHPAAVYRPPPDIHTGGYDDEHLADEFAWAAAELYVTTRDDRYWAALDAAHLPASVPSWSDVGGLAWVTLAQHRDRLTPAADRALIESRVTSLADDLVARTRACAWHVATTGDDFTWGSNSVALNQALMLIQAYRLRGARADLDAAQSLFDEVLGRNAVDSSMVTGFGTRSPLHPHHRPSAADGVDAPIPGFVVGGPQPGQQDAKRCPVPYPSAVPARSWLDHVCSYASNEVAINWNAPLVYVAAALQALTPSP
jgi:alpha-L-arabinofuranosidase